MSRVTDHVGDDSGADCHRRAAVAQSGTHPPNRVPSRRQTGPLLEYEGRRVDAQCPQLLEDAVPRRVPRIGVHHHQRRTLDTSGQPLDRVLPDDYLDLGLAHACP